MFSMRIGRRSLKTKITLTTLVIFVIGIWSSAFYVSRMLRGDMQRQLGEQQFSATTLIAKGIDEELKSRINVMEQYAKGRIVPSMLSNAVALQERLEGSPAILSMFNSGIFVTGVDGVAIASVPASLGRVGTSYMERDHVVAAIRDGRSTIGKPVMGKRMLSPILAIAVPVRDAQGGVIGALVGVTDLSKPNFLDKVTEGSYGKSGGYLLIAPQHKLFVTATDKSRVMQPLPAPGLNAMHDQYMQGFEGYGVAVSSRGVPELSAAKRIPAAGWFVAATLPAQEAFAPIDAMMQRALLSILVFSFLGGVLTWWLITRMLREQFAPMLMASRSLQAQAASDRLLQALPVISQDEIGELIGGFNRLLDTLRKRDEELRESHIKLQSVLDHSPALISIKDLQGVVLIANRQFGMLDAPPLNELIGKSVFDIFPKDVAQALWENDQAAVRSDSTIEVEEIVSHKDGTLHTYLTLKFPVRDSVGKVFGTCAISTDITERKHAEANLKLAANVFSHAREGITITDANGTIIDVNATFSDITGYSREDVIGQNPRILSSGRQGPEFYADLWRNLEVKGHWYGEIWNRRKNGEVYAEMLTISAVRDPLGITQNYVALFSDITAQKEHEGQLEHIAHYDALTNLPNRVLLSDRLQQAMTQAQRRDERVAVAYLDLDGFKAVNDRHGHGVGDQLLIIAASRMKESLREVDTLARLGGDEFVAVLLDLPDIEKSVPMLTRLLQAASMPVEIGNLVLHVSASIGVTFYPQPDAVDADQLLRQADQAMYQAKLAGKNRYHIFDAQQDSSVRGLHEGLERIRRALANHEFVLYYQPKVNMRTGVLIGVEALIRWQCPERGLLPPAVFLPVIEDHPLAIEIGEWVIDAALSQIEQWHAVGLDIPVSVNVSAQQLQQFNFVERLKAILGQHPFVKPASLELEVLETSALEDLAHVSQVIEACQEMGISFALDDFGTGYSSLTYLKRLPVAVLKIDQSFVRDMLDDASDLSILDGVINLAIAFNRKLVAEGVETLEHGAMLLRLGCELGQGYGIARPMPAADILPWADAWRIDPSWCDVPVASRADLPLLYASVEHRAWINALETHLSGERMTPLPLDFHECRFGKWLDTDGIHRHGTHPTYKTIQHVHRQVHALAVEMIELKASGKNTEVLERMDELHGLKVVLLDQLRVLIQAD